MARTLLGLVDLQVDGEAISRLAEIALAICLFTDSSNANLSVLRRVEAIPVRLLLIGLPLTIALGLGLAWLIFRDLGFFEVALIATMLAPTDAALGKAVVTNPAVPDEGAGEFECRKRIERRHLRAGDFVFHRAWRPVRSRLPNQPGLLSNCRWK